MSEKPFERIIDNNAEILEDQKEGSVRDVLEYYVKKVIENEEENGLKFRMDIGTGYLFFSGFKETADLLQDLIDKDLLTNIQEEDWDSEAPIRVVMGPETSEITKDILTSLIKDDISKYQDSAVELLKKLIEDNLIEFRVFLDRKFHAKIYNFYQSSKYPDDIWAGSANFSKGGLSNNIELSIPMHTTSARRELFREWFDELWKQSTQDLDVLEIIDEVEEHSFLKYHPRIFFSKLIKLLNKDYLLQEEKTCTDNILLDFQNLSYYIVMERLQKYGGYILANSVGLGKSYVACQAIRSYQRENPDKKCLIVYPPRVKSEWETYVKEEFEIFDSVDMISMGKLQKTPYEDREDDYYFDHRDFAEEYSLIVVDEIHHYRNPSNRTKNLKSIISSNPQADSLFLSATPVNLGSEDLFNIIDLFYRGENVHKFENQGLRELYDRTRQDVKKIGRGGKART